MRGVFPQYKKNKVLYNIYVGKHINKRKSIFDDTEKTQKIAWLYEIKKMSTYSIALQMDISSSTVNIVLHELGIEVKRRKYLKKNIPKKLKCKNCDMLLSSKFHTLPCK